MRCLTQLLASQFEYEILSDDYLITVLKYYVDNARTVDPAKLQEMLEEELRGFKKGEVMATIASHLTQKGRQECGASLLMNMLKVKFNDLSDAYIEKINRADVNTLNQWCINFVNANSLDEVFG